MSVLRPALMLVSAGFLVWEVVRGIISDREAWKRR